MFDMFKIILRYVKIKLHETKRKAIRNAKSKTTKQQVPIICCGLITLEI